MSTTASAPKKPLAARFLEWMIEHKPDVLFGLIRNTRPNLVVPGAAGPVFVTRFRDVQEALERPDIFNVTYAPMIDPSVGPFMLSRDNTSLNQREKGIMRSLIQREDLPRVRGMIARLTEEAVAPQLDRRQIEVVNTVSRWVPMKLTGEYFGFPGPDMKSMLRWSRATQYDMFHNQDQNPDIHQDNIDAGHEMKAFLNTWIPARRAQLADHPERDDILSRLLKSTFPDAIEFDEDRIATNIMGTLIGGGETTSQAIVQILDQLFQRPTELAEATNAAKADDDALLYSYCWEALRFNPVNPFVIRRCSKDYRIASGTLRGTTIKAGKIVLVSTRSAMRDGRELPAAGSFATDRPSYHYMHLGYGTHTCLGDHVSRVQVPEIVKRLLKLPGVRPTGPIDFKGGPFPESYVLEFD
jgi:cytochrome P450